MREALAIAAAMVAPMVASAAAAEAPGQPPAARLNWPGKTPAPAAAPPPATQPAVIAAPHLASSPSAATPVTVAEAPARPDGPRRYSVHRDFGETPDRPQLPTEFFLDGPPVDLADPPPQPLSERDERRLRSDAASPDTLSN